MAREYLNVRLSYEAKYWLEQLQEYKQQELNKRIDNGLVEDIEKKIFEEFSLDGVSTTIILKVSASSIIEDAFRSTKTYSIEKWKKVNSKLIDTEKEIDFKKKIGTLTPRFYLDTNIIKGLEKYCITFMTEKNIRSVKLSYVIKCVIHAYYLEIKNCFEDA
ncbi:hypothetical protein Z967_06610 [Clostridium novyi A str. 4540]|uniref:hypothetical protein n=1 Tax=Clostridium novyi TaxID=1542 RepID=UPI0004D5488B|nr:hypothetical protein [Clostridium novyi]KEH89735.1 hypothetical protein Z967_06610 [Clostridium novyi A str. 4540]